MKRILKWTGIIVGSLIVLGFLAFLYFIPPFDFIPPEEFVRQITAAGPSLEAIANPAERAIAERGKYIVTTFDCSGCHTPQGDEGPNWNEYLAGGAKTSFKGYHSFVSRNLTPDKETGLARRSNEQVMRILRSGVLADGRVTHYRDMPWVGPTNLTEEDRYAIMVYLRHLKPVYHRISDPAQAEPMGDPDACEMLGTLDYGGHAKQH